MATSGTIRGTNTGDIGTLSLGSTAGSWLLELHDLFVDTSYPQVTVGDDNTYGVYFDGNVINFNQATGDGYIVLNDGGPLGATGSIVFTSNIGVTDPFTITINYVLYPQ